MSFVETTDGDLYSTTGAVLRAAVAVENAPYALMGTGKGSVVEAASCSPGIDQEGPVAAVASCTNKIGRDGSIAAVASCGDF